MTANIQQATKDQMIAAAKARWARMGMIKQTPVVVIPKQHELPVIEDKSRKVIHFKPVVMIPDEYLIKIPRTRMSTLREILDLVIEDFGVSHIDIMSRRRTRNITVARQAAMYLCKNCTYQSLPQIGRFLNLDHTTILHGVSKTKHRMETLPGFRERITALQARMTHVVSSYVYWGA